jgi:NhaP-type Na+/H+ or K+/H+ antiporter
MDTHELQENWQPKLWIRLVVLAAVVAYAIAFVIENGKRVHVHFVLGTATVRLIWVVLLSLALGLVSGILLAQLDRRRRRRGTAE